MKITLSLLLGSTLALGACTLPPYDHDIGSPETEMRTTGPEEGIEEMEKEIEVIEQDRL